jgi:hypothetical protein
MSESVTKMAREMLREARIEGCPGAYVATGHSTDNISIIHQQVRCINLSWALVRLRKIKHGSVVGIVGGSFSGLMLAVSLAVQRRCIVYIYEKEPRLLNRFRRSPYRYINTNVNSRDLPPRFNLKFSRPIYDLPIFAWDYGTASEVAHRWLREFQEYYAHLPIFVRTGIEVTDSKQETHGVRLRLEAGEHARDENVDVAILATGFGGEQNPFETEDWSYWQSGSSLQYRPGRLTDKKDKILISGCGDSGIVELMHYVFRGFDHENIDEYFPAGLRIESYVQPTLEQSRYWSIRYSKEIERFDRKVISELCWYLTTKEFRDYNPGIMKELAKGSTRKEKAFSLLEGELLGKIGDLLEKSGLPSQANFSYWRDVDRAERHLVKMSIDEQFAIRDALDPLISDLASMELDLKIGGMKLSAFLDLAPIRTHLSKRFEIWMNDVTPTAYTEKISPANLIFLNLCQTIEDVRYVQGRLTTVKPTRAGYDVEIAGGNRMKFERVSTRFGTRHSEATKKMIGGHPRKVHFGDWLLEWPIEYQKDPKDKAIIQQVDLARDSVADGVTKLRLSRRYTRFEIPVLDKPLYIASLSLADSVAKRFSSPELINTEKQLKARLHRGQPVSYPQPTGTDIR